MKEVSHRRPHFVRFSLYEMSRINLHTVGDCLAQQQLSQEEGGLLQGTGFLLGVMITF